jgi:hypothetical protein
MAAEVDDLKKRLDNEVADHARTKNCLTQLKEGYSMIQRIAESAGAITSDREDILSLYRR